MYLSRGENDQHQCSLMTVIVYNIHKPPYIDRLDIFQIESVLNKCPCCLPASTAIFNHLGNDRLILLLLSVLSPTCPPSLIINTFSQVHWLTLSLNHLPIPSRPQHFVLSLPLLVSNFSWLVCTNFTPTHSFVFSFIDCIDLFHWSCALILLLPTYNRCTSVFASVVLYLSSMLKV